MGVPVRYGVVYALSVIGRDVKSAKPVVNIFHVRCGAALAPPAWGSPLAGSNTQTVLTTFRTDYIANILPLMSVNLAVNEYKLQSIDGWTTGGPTNPVAGATNATPIVITTAAPHGLTTGSVVIIAGCTGNTAANGTWTITRLSSMSFSLNASGGNGAYAGGGTWAKVAGDPRLVHTDQDSYVPVTADLGTVAGEALPLIATMSVRKLNTRVGRNWRGRLSMSPLPEAGYNDGHASNAQHALNVTGWNNQVTSLNFANKTPPAANQDYMIYMQFSHAIAVVTTTPFTSETPYSVPLTDMVPRQNNGGLTRRKPKLTAPIS